MITLESYAGFLMVLAANVAGILLAFRRDKCENLRMSLACVVITAAVVLYRFTGAPTAWLDFLPGVIYLPSLYFILKGSVAQKLFVTFSVLSITHLLYLGVWFVTPAASAWRYGLLALVLAGYVALMAWQGSRFVGKVFSSAGGGWWGYALYAAAFYTVMMRMYGVDAMPPRDPHSRWFYFLLPVFALAGFALFLVAILRTYERAVMTHELDFARHTLNTGRGYYESLTDTLEQVRILQHDYKHQLAVLSQLAHDGGRRQEALDYLDSIAQHYEGIEAEHYAANPVLDALLAHYAGRIKAAGVTFDAQVAMPAQTPVDNYDLCVVLGNLLDNALRAAAALPAGQGRVKLTVRWKEPQLALRVENTCGAASGERAATAGVHSGTGTRSVRAVADKYGGVYESERSENCFTAYVLLRK